MFWIAATMAATGLAFGILKALFGDWDSTGDRVVLAALVAGGGALIAIGLLAFSRAPWIGATLVSVGAVTCATGVFWTLLLPVLALVLVVLSFLHARSLARALQPGT
jgi:hypothetical protein